LVNEELVHQQGHDHENDHVTNGHEREHMDGGFPRLRVRRTDYQRHATLGD